MNWEAFNTQFEKISLRLDTDVNCNLYTNIYIENLQEILHAK